MPAAEGRSSLWGVLASRVPPAAAPNSMKLSILMSSFGDGGVERMVINTACGLAARGVEIRFFSGNPEGVHLERLKPPVALEILPRESRPRMARLVQHLRDDRPDAVLVAKAPDFRLALKARRRAGCATSIVMRPGTTITARVRGPAGRWKLWRLARLYRRADAIIANSAGVRDDIARVTGVPEARIHLVRNPVITPDLETLAAAPLEHPWLDDPDVPVVIGAGGLRQQKDFTTLIRALALLRRRRPARLLLLGQGRQEARLRELTDELGLKDCVEFVGFVNNPYPWLARCSLFALSSRWEGSPNVLTEALALGTPVVSTDCRSGPREILDGGRYGPLVPVGDSEALAGAMDQILDAPPEAASLRQATIEYTQERNAEHYHRILLELTEPRHD